MPNYVSIPAHGDGLGKAVVAVEITTWSLAFISCILRISASRVKGLELRTDDYLIFWATFFAAGLTVVHCYMAFQGGLGLKPEDSTPDSEALSLKMFPPSDILWSIANSLVKLSFLGFFATVFSLQKYKRRFRVVGVICVLLAVSNVIRTLAICRPIAAQWDKSIPGAVCGDLTLGILLVAWFNLGTDLIIFALPVAPLWRLHGMSQRKRGGLILIFCLGSFVCCITILRIIFTFQLSNDPQDQIYWTGINALFLQLEPVLGIIAACIPTWQPLWAAGSMRSVFVRTTRPSSDQVTGPSRRNTRHFAKIPDSGPNAHTVIGPSSITTAEANTSTLIDRHQSSGSGAKGITVTTEVAIEHEDVEMQSL